MDETDQSHFYADPVVYDILHAAGTAEEARVIEGVARARAPRRGASLPLRFLEPACGTARHLRKLAAMGHHGVGFDLSEAMIEDATARAARAGLRDRVTLFTADMADFADRDGAGKFSGRFAGKVDLAFNLINTFRHLSTDAAVLAHLRQIAGCLKKSGAYVVGMSVTDYDLEQPSEDVWSGARGRCRVTQTVNYMPPDAPRHTAAGRTETVISHIRIERPGSDEHRDSVYTLRTYSLDELTDLIDRSALRIDAVTDDLGEEMSPPTIGYAFFHLCPA